MKHLLNYITEAAMPTKEQEIGCARVFTEFWNGTHDMSNIKSISDKVFNDINKKKYPKSWSTSWVNCCISLYELLKNSEFASHELFFAHELDEHNFVSSSLKKVYENIRTSEKWSVNSNNIDPSDVYFYTENLTKDENWQNLLDAKNIVAAASAMTGLITNGSLIGVSLKKMNECKLPLLLNMTKGETIPSEISFTYDDADKFYIDDNDMNKYLTSISKFHKSTYLFLKFSNVYDKKTHQPVTIKLNFRTSGGNNLRLSVEWQHDKHNHEYQIGDAPKSSWLNTINEYLRNRFRYSFCEKSDKIYDKEIGQIVDFNNPTEYNEFFNSAAEFVSNIDITNVSNNLVDYDQRIVYARQLIIYIAINNMLGNNRDYTLLKLTLAKMAFCAMKINHTFYKNDALQQHIYMPHVSFVMDRRTLNSSI